MERNEFIQALSKLSNENIGILIKPANGVVGISLTADELDELRKITSRHKQREEESKEIARELTVPNGQSDVTRVQLLEDALADNQVAHARDAIAIRGLVVLACDRQHKPDPVATEAFVAKWAPSFGQPALVR